MACENSDDRTTVRPNLVGSIVTELTQLPQLELLDLSHNNLKGNTPRYIPIPSTLTIAIQCIVGDDSLQLFWFRK